jgi:hypothetical protein
VEKIKQEKRKNQHGLKPERLIIKPEGKKTSDYHFIACYFIIHTNEEIRNQERRGNYREF